MLIFVYFAQRYKLILKQFVCPRLKTTTLSNSSHSLNPIFEPHFVCMLLDYKVQQTTSETSLLI